MRTLFNSLVDTTEGLSKATTAEQVIDNMNYWEQANPEKLEYSYVRGFFGATNVANGMLKKKTSLHFIPAVANVPEETSDPKKSPIINLLSEIARQTYQNREEVRKFIERTQTDFDSLVSPHKFPQLGAISDRLTATIQKYYSDSQLLADWRSDEGIKFSFPQPSIKVEDNGFLSGLEHVGHGLQRAALFSVIEFLAQSRTEAADEEFDEAQSDIVLLIEEPEIYQHPHKQKLVSAAFRSICDQFSKSTGIRFQVVFATHSEKFVDIENFHTARIMRKTVTEETVEHKVSALSIKECSEYFANLLQKKTHARSCLSSKATYFFSRSVRGFFRAEDYISRGCC